MATDTKVAPTLCASVFCGETETVLLCVAFWDKDDTVPVGSAETVTDVEGCVRGDDNEGKEMETVGAGTEVGGPVKTLLLCRVVVVVVEAEDCRMVLLLLVVVVVEVAAVVKVELVLCNVGAVGVSRCQKKKKKCFYSFKPSSQTNTPLLLIPVPISASN